ncbi:MAG: hypothetical protein Q9222_002688 [Ikaeria aurantiellina]
MASVRSMLRNELANRRINHPHLTYSSNGALLCNVCHIQFKTEALWTKHVNSAQHITNVQAKTQDSTRRSEGAPKSSNNANGSNNGRKRKADDDSSDDETRKRTRGDQTSDHILQPAREGDAEIQDDIDNTNKGIRRQDLIEPISSSLADRKRKQSPVPAEAQPENPSHPPTNTNGTPNTTINEDEWAAFQRDIAATPPPPEITSALTATADISAAPMTAAELAAQSREQASRQAKGRLEAEVEGEKEDAERQMEEEFEEMAELEERVRRLREKRERLRVGGGGDRRVEVDGGEEGGGNAVVGENGLGNGGVESQSGSDEDDGDDEWGAWGR